MHFFKALAGLAMASLAYAQSKSLYFTSQPSHVSVGTPVTIKYMAANMQEPVHIILRKGSSNNLMTIATLTTMATGGSYTWDPSQSLSSGDDYALEITQGDEVNYTGEFSVSGGNAPAPAPTSMKGAKSVAPVHTAHPTQYASTESGPVMSSAPVIMTTSTPVASVPMTSYVPSGTGHIPMHRNTTFSKPTLKTTSKKGPTPVGPTSVGITSVSPAPSAQPTTGAASTLDSSLALVLGAVAAIIYLQ